MKSIADIAEDMIYSVDYFTAEEGVLGAACARAPTIPAKDIAYHDGESDAFNNALKHTTICVMVLDNGHRVVGVAHCRTPKTFDADKGRDAARRDAFSQVIKLAAFRGVKLADFR